MDTHTHTHTGLNKPQQASTGLNRPGQGTQTWPGKETYTEDQGGTGLSGGIVRGLGPPEGAGTWPAKENRVLKK